MWERLMKAGLMARESLMYRESGIAMVMQYYIQRAGATRHATYITFLLRPSSSASASSPLFFLCTSFSFISIVCFSFALPHFHQHPFLSFSFVINASSSIISISPSSSLLPPALSLSLRPPFFHQHSVFPLRPPFLSTGIISSPSPPTLGPQEERPKFKVSWLVEVPAELLRAVHRKEGPRRGIIYAILFSHICIFFAMNPLYFLFFKLMFDWDATDYSNWLFYRDMTKAIALVVLMPVFVGRLQLPDTALGLLGCSSVAFMQIALGQIVSSSMTWVALLGPLLGMLELFAHLASRSIMSKCSDGSRELGKLFAAQAVLDSIATGFAGPLYAAVYSSSVDSLPMAQFLLAALFMFLAVLGIRVCDIFLQKKEAAAWHEDRQEKA